MKDEDIRLLAELLEGLQVPLSIGVPLGTAREPYVQLRGKLHLFGYPTVEEHEWAIRKHLLNQGDDK